MVEFTITVDLPQKVYDKMVELLPEQEDRINFVLNTFKQRCIQEDLSKAKKDIEEDAQTLMQTKQEEIIQEYQ